MLYKIVGYKKLSKSYVVYLRCLSKSKDVVGTLTHQVFVSDKLADFIALDREIFIHLSKDNEGKYKEKIKFIERG